MSGMNDDLIPPQEILDLTCDGTPRAEYPAYGENFVSIWLVDRAKLRPCERVLEIGSGNGNKARALTTYLNEHGSYRGLDIIPAGIEWCQQRYRHHPNFQFQLADIYNDKYNPKGKIDDVGYTLPFSSDEFDLVFLCSVFTHMLEEGIARYVSEVARVLKTGGRCFASFFLLNADTVHWMSNGSPVFKFAHRRKHAMLINRKIRSEVVAMDEEWVRRAFLKARLRITDVTYGYWCGASDLTGSLQDSIIAIKM